jgi:hypothetical protein
MVDMFLKTEHATWSGFRIEELIELLKYDTIKEESCTLVAFFYKGEYLDAFDERFDAIT